MYTGLFRLVWSDSTRISLRRLSTVHTAINRCNLFHIRELGRYRCCRNQSRFNPVQRFCVGPQFRSTQSHVIRNQWSWSPRVGPLDTAGRLYKGCRSNDSCFPGSCFKRVEGGRAEMTWWHSHSCSSPSMAVSLHIQRVANKSLLNVRFVHS